MVWQRAHLRSGYFAERRVTAGLIADHLWQSTLFLATAALLGLKLESTRGPVEAAVIDRADDPTED